MVNINKNTLIYTDINFVHYMYTVYALGTKMASVPQLYLGVVLCFTCMYLPPPLTQLFCLCRVSFSLYQPTYGMKVRWYEWWDDDVTRGPSVRLALAWLHKVWWGGMYVHVHTHSHFPKRICTYRSNCTKIVPTILRYALISYEWVKDTGCTPPKKKIGKGNRHQL